jgi:hypothetical protein
MTESGKRGRAMVTQRNTNLACLHSETNKKPHHKSSFLLDTSLSTSPLPANSTRHSVTGRIDRNSRLLCYLIFSTRHLNATLVKRNFVEKFNTCVRFFAASRSFSKPKIGPRNRVTNDHTPFRDGRINTRSSHSDTRPPIATQSPGKVLESHRHCLFVNSPNQENR